MPKGPVKSGIIANDTPPPETTDDERQQTFPGIDPPPPPPPEDPSSKKKVATKKVPTPPPPPPPLEEEEALPEEEDEEEAPPEEENGEEGSEEEEASKDKLSGTPTSKKSDSSRKRSFGDVMIMEKMTLPHPANKEGEKDRIEAYRLIDESIIEGQSPADAERWLVKEIESSNGVIGGGEFVIIRRVKTVKVEAEIIRKVTLEEIED